MDNDNNLQQTEQMQPDLRQQSTDYSPSVPFEEPSANPVLCLIGAAVGAIPGCILWLILGQVGFIAGIAGYVIMIGAMKGNKILGGKISKNTLIMCGIITVIMIFATNCLDYAVSFYKMALDEGYAISFTEVLWIMPEVLTDSEVIGGFALNLVIGYALTALSCRRVFVK